MACLGVAWGCRPADTLIEAGAGAIVDTAEQIVDWIEKQNVPGKRIPGNGT